MPTTNYTDTQLLRMFPVLLPGEIQYQNSNDPECRLLFWITHWNVYGERDIVKPTEYLDLCRQIEEKLDIYQRTKYLQILEDIEKMTYKIPCPEIVSSPSRVFDWILTHASWQQRLIALCEVLGKEIPEV